MQYPWYLTLDNYSNELQQGDLIPDCPIVIPPADIIQSSKIDVGITLIDSVILSQSCDLQNQKIENVLVCPFFSLTTFIAELKDQSSNSKRKVVENLKKGNLPGYHLLNKEEGIPLLNDYTVVDFRNIYGIQINALSQIVAKLETRYRLLPLYREHLSQAFARFFMRVGLPQDINIPNTYFA